MEISIIIYIFIIVVFMIPITRHIITNIYWKDFIKRLLGIILCGCEVLMILYYINLPIFARTNILMILLALVSGIAESILSTFIRNYNNRKVLIKLFCNLTFEKKSILRKMLHGLISCGIEEIVWRGVVQGGLFIQQELLIIVLTSLAFTVSHIKRKMYFSDMVEIFILSCILGIIMIHKKNILYCFTFHWARNCTIDIISYNANKVKPGGKL